MTNNEQPVTNNHKEGGAFFRRPIVYRTAIGLYVALVLVLAGIIFSVNSLDVQTAVYLRADAELETNRTHGARGVLHHAPTGEVLYPETMQWVLKRPDDGISHNLEFVHGPADETWPTPTFRLPDDIEPGSWELWFEATHERSAPLQTAHRITVAERPPPATSLHDLSWPRPQYRNDDPSRALVRPVDTIDLDEEGEPDEDADEPTRVKLDVAPPTGELMRGLEQTLYLRTFDADDGTPIAADVELKITEGQLDHDIDEPITTNRLGIGSTTIQPTHSIEVEFRVTPHDDDIDAATFQTRFDSATSQYALRPTSRVITPGDTIEAGVTTTMPGDTFTADLLDVEGRRFLDGLSLRMSDRAGGIKLDAPESGEASRLLSLQTYQSPYGTQRAWDSSYLLFVGDDSHHELQRITEELYEWIGEHTGSEHHRRLVDDRVFDDLSEAQLRALITAGLEEIPRSFELPPVLLNTRDTDREALDAWREEMKRDLNRMMVFTLAIGIVVVMYLVILGIRRQREDAQKMRDLALEEGEIPSEQQLRDERLERYTVVLQGLIVFLTLIAFAVGIWLMVTYV